MEAVTNQLLAFEQVCLYQKVDVLDDSIAALLTVLEEQARLNSVLFLSLLNIKDSNLSFVSNFIIKVYINTLLLASTNQFNSKSIAALLRCNLLICYAITPTLYKLKKQPKLWSKLRVNLYKAPLLAFKKIHKAQIQDQDALRLLSQLAGLNEFKQTNQLAQSINIVALNAAFHAAPCLPTEFLSADQAILACLTKPLLISPKAFVSQFQNRLALAATKYCCCGTIVRLKGKSIACLLTKKVSGSWLAFEFKGNKIDQNAEIVEVRESELLVAFPQQKFDANILVNLYLGNQHLIIEDDLLAPNFHEKQNKFYHPILDFKKTSKLLLSEHNNKITNFLKREPRQSALLLEHATLLNRQQTTIHQISHAIALLGMARLYPVIANADIQICHEKDNYLGSAQVIERARQFSLISAAVSKLTQIDLPEYCQLIANIVFLGLITIPRAKYAAASNNKYASDAHNLAQLFDVNDINSWYKTSIDVAAKWHLPNRYHSALVALFDVMSGRANFNELPKSSAKLVAVLSLSQYLYIEFSRGALKPEKLQQHAYVIKVLGTSNQEVMALYSQLVDQVTPVCSLT